MKSQQHYAGWVIVASFIAALMLEIMPLPGEAEVLAPSWVVMTLLYWCMMTPERVGVGIGWLVGLLLDVAVGVLLGQHAAVLALIAYLVLKLHQRLRLFPVWQQALVVLALVALSQMLVIWVKGVSGAVELHAEYVLTAFTSALLWPLVYFVLNEARIRYGVR